MKIELIDHLGTDDRVVDAARVSFAKEAANYTHDQNDKLISYLSRNGHWSPFAHVSITMRETIPIFLARQRFKHIVGFTYNEVSRRYVDDPPEFFYPEWRRKADNKKQGSAEEFEEQLQEHFGEKLWDFHSMAEDLYYYYLANGVCPEQARVCLPQSMYTSYYVTGSLAAWARAYTQRTHDHAQREWDEVTDQWNKIIELLFPVSWKALTNQ